jgi:hypothetical protein
VGRTTDDAVIRTMTATEVAAAYRLPLGTVYRLASEDDWGRTLDGRRPVLYRAEDVEGTMTRRESEEAP